MAKLKSKIGDVFQTLTTPKPYYIALLAIDQVQMNSDVIMVFSDLSLKNPLFYMHTSVDFGVKDGLWEKIDEDKNTINCSKLPFRTIMEDELSSPPKPYWNYWTLSDSNWKKVTLDEAKRMPSTEGSVYPTDDVIYRIENGKSRFKQIKLEEGAREITIKEIESLIRPNKWIGFVKGK